MKNKYSLIIILFVGVALTSCIKDNKTDALKSPFLTTVIMNGDTEKESTNLSEIIPDYHRVQLETNDSCIIDDSRATIKKKFNRYFVLSADEVFEFSSDGAYIGKLSMKGNGPGEYQELSDFDVADGGRQLWISSGKSIYKYAIPEYSFIGKVDFEFPIFSFRILDDDAVIMDTPEELRFKIADANGSILKEFYKKDPANSMASGFEKWGDKVVYHIDLTNEALVYDLASDSMYVAEISQPYENLLTSEVNARIFNEVGMMMQWKKAAESYEMPYMVKTVGDKTIATVLTPAKEWKIYFADGNTQKGYVYYSEKGASLTNDIFKTDNDPAMLNAIRVYSDDSFILPASSEDQNLELIEFKDLNIQVKSHT